MVKRLTKKRLVASEPDVVRNISDVQDLEENTVALFYGKAGKGKTHTAATFPTPNLFLDINNEKGLKTVKQVPGVKFTKITAWEEFQDLHAWLAKGQDYATITLDQITGLQDLAVAEVRRILRMSDDEPFQGFKKWGELSGQMKTWLQAYRELSSLYNITFLAHERQFGGDEEADVNDLSPSVAARTMPSVGSFIDGACDIIGQSFIRIDKKRVEGKIVKRTQYCLRIGPHPTYVTKIRRPADAGPIPEFIVNPTYEKLLALERGEELSSSKPKKLKRRL